MAVAQDRIPSSFNGQPVIIHRGKIRPGKSAETQACLSIPDGRHMLTPEQAKLLVVLRYAEDPVNGYQRKLNGRRVQEIMKDLQKKSESDYPEIFVANIGGSYEVVDGQHRLQGHIDANRPIAARVKTMSRRKAIDLFLRDNAKAKALGRADLIRASRTPRAMFIKDMSKEFNISHAQVSQLMKGLDSDATFTANLSCDESFTKEQQNAATKILNIWTADTRWLHDDEKKTYTRKGGLPSVEAAYSSKTTLFVLGRIARNHLSERDYIGRIRADVETVKSAQWDKQGVRSLRGYQGGTNHAQKALLTFIQTEVLLKARWS